MHDDQQQQSPYQSMSQQFNIVIAIAQIISKVGDVFMRRPGTWGSRHASLQMILSFLFLLCFGPMTFPRENPAALVYLFAAATVMLLVHRIAGVWRRWRGYRVHSLYTGKSWFIGSERAAKTLLEPMTFAAFAVFASGHARALSAYLVIVAVCGTIANAWLVQAEEARIQSVLDAQHDAEWMQSEMQRRMGQ